MKHEGKLYILLLLIWSSILLAACGDSRLSPPLPKAVQPSWSPDGQQIVYVCYMEGEIFIPGEPWGGTLIYPEEAADICVMNYDGTNKRRLVRDQGADSAPAWSPDGKTLAFTSAFTSAFASNNGLYLVDANGSKPRRLFGFVQEYSWSPNGNQIAFVDCRPQTHGADNGSDLYIIDKDGQNLIKVENPIMASLAYPRWSPDGRQLAYISTLDPRCLFAPSGAYTNSLMVADAQEAFQPRKVVDNLPYLFDLMWTGPETLAYSRSRDGRADLYTLDLKSGLRTRIETAASGIHYAFSPDGTTLAYSASEGATEVIYIQDRSSGQAESVWSLDGANVFALQWSRDSQHLLLTVSEPLPPSDIYTNPADVDTIWVISRDGTFAKRVTPLMPGELGP